MPLGLVLTRQQDQLGHCSQRFRRVRDAVHLVRGVVPNTLELLVLHSCPPTPNGPSHSGFRDAELPADAARRVVIDFPMPGHTTLLTVGGIDPHRMSPALAQESATVFF